MLESFRRIGLVSFFSGVSAFVIGSVLEEGNETNTQETAITIGSVLAVSGLLMLICSPLFGKEENWDKQPEPSSTTLGNANTSSQGNHKSR